MKRRRQQKVEKKLQQCRGQDGQGLYQLMSVCLSVSRVGWTRLVLATVCLSMSVCLSLSRAGQTRLMSAFVCMSGMKALGMDKVNSENL